MIFFYYRKSYKIKDDYIENEKDHFLLNINKENITETNSMYKTTLLDPQLLLKVLLSSIAKSCVRAIDNWKVDGFLMTLYHFFTHTNDYAYYFNFFPEHTHTQPFKKSSIVHCQEARALSSARISIRRWKRNGFRPVTNT